MKVYFCIGVINGSVDFYVELFDKQDMRNFLLIVVGLVFCHNIIAQPEKWGYWTKWGDQGNGTYLNPIIV